MVSYFAVVDIDHAHPPAEPGCAYQVPLDQSDAPVYQCYTQAQWDARNAQIAQQQAAQQAATDKWIADHQWVLWGGLGLLALMIVALLVAAWKHHKAEKAMWGNYYR